MKTGWQVAHELDRRISPREQRLLNAQTTASDNELIAQFLRHHVVTYCPPRRADGSLLAMRWTRRVSYRR